MDVRQIRDFVAVVRCSSFAAASRNLRVSQPGLGYQVKQLEDELQVQLLQRHARGVSLTRAGQTFLDHAESILAAINNAKVAMAAIAQDDRQELRIGIAPSLVQALGAVLLASSAHQKKIRLREAYAVELHEGLRNGSLDIAVCLSEGMPPLRSIPVYSEPLYLVGPNPRSSEQLKKISMSEVTTIPLVLGHRDQLARRLLEDAAVRAGKKLMVDQETESQALLRSLVLHSGRYTVASYGTFAEEISNGSLSARSIVDPEIRQSVNVVYSAALPLFPESVAAMLVRSILENAPLPAEAVYLGSSAAA